MTTLTNDNTSLQAWAAEEAARIRGLGNENNLDPSYHGARVAIISKADSGAMDIGGLDPTKPILRWQHSRRNCNQWIRLEKVDPKVANSPWYLRCDREDQDPRLPTPRYNMFVCDVKGISYPTLSSENKTLSTWLISWASDGYYRIKNENGYYLANQVKTDVPPESPQGCFIRTVSRDETDLLLWRIERLSTPFLVDNDDKHLDPGYSKQRVALVEISGVRSLDVGGENNLVYLRNVDTPNDPQILTLEKVQDGNTKSPWRIHGNYLNVAYNVAAATTEPRVVVRAAPKADALEQQWYIRQTPAGVFRIQNVQSKFYLESMPVGGSNLRTALSDKGSGAEQLWTVIKLPPAPAAPK